MCLDPLTAILGIASAGMSAMGSIQQGNAQAAAAQRQADQERANAELQARQSVIQQTTSQYEQRRKVEQNEAFRGQQRNAFAATGLLAEGSPTDVAMDTASEQALDVQAIQWNSKLKSQNLDYTAYISTMNADANERAAREAKKAGMIGALTGAVGGLSRLATPSSATSLGLRF